MGRAESVLLNKRSVLVPTPPPVELFGGRRGALGRRAKSMLSGEREEVFRGMEAAEGGGGRDEVFRGTVRDMVV
jgi:hypothetical protein